MAPEAWWIETEPARIGWYAIARNAAGEQLGVATEGGTVPHWRLTERGAYRRALRHLRRWLKERERRAAREERIKLYPVQL